MAIPGNFLSQVTESIDPNTSGWTPLLNCTLSKGTGGRNGDGVLTVKSVAAGEMRARTVSSYAVTPGTVYQTFADASGSIVEKIGLRWLSPTNIELSISWSLTTASASASLHRVGVAAPAPVGAARAQVVLSSSPAGAAVTHLWENVYLGLPIRSTGNLLPFGTESFEIDASGWTSELNATVGRAAPAVQWPVTWYYSGGAILTVTAIANGDVAARTVERPVVTEGIEYTAYCYLSPPTTGSDSWIEIRFYDATDTQLTATRGELAAASTGYQRQRVSAIAPAGAVTCGVTVGMDGATAAQILRVEQVVVTVAPGFQAGSVVRYADASFEQGVAGWTKTSGVATIARSTPWGAAAADGSYCLTVTSATATASTIRSAKFPLPSGSEGQDFRLSFYEQVAAGSWTTTRGVRWYDAADTDLGATGTGASAAPSPGWWKLSRDQTAPAGATQAAVELTLTAGAINSTIRLDAVALWQAEPLMEVDVIPASASITITLRELTLDRGILIYRITPDGTRTLVRGPNGLYDGTVVITSDQMVIEDYEAPLLTPVYYYVEVIDPADLSHQNRTSDPVTIPHDDPDEAWLKDPGNPQRNCRVLMQTAPVWSRPIEQATHRVAGRRNAVVLSGVRSGLEGDLQIWTRTDEERASLHWLLDSGNVILWQAAPGKGVSDMYVSVGSITEARSEEDADDPWRAWTLPLTEADMPVTTGVNGSAGRTWQDILSEFATWQEVLETYATWEDVFLDRRIGG
ncbi:hypothetical protein GCM10011583_66190 [Streptomyces camponoticapitis]|uniref:Minor tail protein n=1 Tax=Streptomyces camponoticapitis TaxID=1616125 RepID=A0ABQ2ETG6_9ACTN|nr:hypothetical protein GCM10011583_66190 [Streptomyces camponoticapitis]